MERQNNVEKGEDWLIPSFHLCDGGVVGRHVRDYYLDGQEDARRVQLHLDDGGRVRNLDVWFRTKSGDRLRALSALARDKPMQDGRSTAYVCKGQTCFPPVTDPAALKTLLQAGSQTPLEEQAPSR